MSDEELMQGLSLAIVHLRAYYRPVNAVTEAAARLEALAKDLEDYRDAAVVWKQDIESLAAKLAASEWTRGEYANLIVKKDEALREVATELKERATFRLKQGDEPQAHLYNRMRLLLESAINLKPGAPQ